MRSHSLLWALLFSCAAEQAAPPKDSPSTGAASATAPATTYAEAAASSPTTAATNKAQPTSAPVALLLPERLTAPKRYTVDRSILDCADHRAWSEPEGWEAAEVSGGVMAYSPDGAAAILRTSTKDRSGEEARAMAEKLVGAPLHFETPVTNKKHKWSWTITTEGEGALESGPALVTLIQGSSRAERDSLWVLVAVGPEANNYQAKLLEVVAGALMLVDHACACGYDCYPPGAVARVTR